VLRTRGHRLSVTSAIASEDGKYLFTSGKEGSIIKWDLPSGRKVATFHKLKPDDPDVTKGKGKGKSKASGEDMKGHTDEVLALALSSDGKYLASGGKDRKVGIWDVEKGEWVKGFMGHKDSISVSCITSQQTDAVDTGHIVSGLPERLPTALQRVFRPDTKII
jgi:ribosomal RNA-processing protein 9